MVDDRSGARQAAEHLLALGHRRFGILSLEITADGRTGLVDRVRRRAEARYGGTRDRLAGYEDALTAAGIDFDAVPIVESPNDRQGARRGAATLLDSRPDITAILAMSDVLGDRRASRRRGGAGLRVPEDLSVVGYDDVPEAAAADPPLTTIAQPIVEKGRLAAHMIFDPGPPRQEILAGQPRRARLDRTGAQPALRPP